MGFLSTCCSGKRAANEFEVRLGFRVKVHCKKITVILTVKNCENATVKTC